MANPEHLEILKQGASVWNQWRLDHRDVTPDLEQEKLNRADLSYFDLAGSNLRRAQLRGANLVGTALQGANLYNADLVRANFSFAQLDQADLQWTASNGVNFQQANLWKVDLSGSDLTNANFTWATLYETNFSDVQLGGTTFGHNDLSTVKGIETVRHLSLSAIGIGTLYRSQGSISADFLRGCGVPDNFITYAESLVKNPIEFYSCFISYSTKDEEFAKRLCSRLRDARVKVYYAGEDMKGGEKVLDQIERAIQLNDKLLLILSEHSIQSNWVETEIRRAIEVGRKESRQKLFPIRLMDQETLKQWRCFDSDSGRDLAVEVRKYFIPDFSNWKYHDSFEETFDRLLRDLRTAERREANHVRSGS